MKTIFKKLNDSQFSIIQTINLYSELVHSQGLDNELDPIEEQLDPVDEITENLELISLHKVKHHSSIMHVVSPDPKRPTMDKKFS